MKKLIDIIFIIFGVSSFGLGSMCFASSFMYILDFIQKMNETLYAVVLVFLISPLMVFIGYNLIKLVYGKKN